ncbi:DUF4376 domain-containing protein [Laribacter hongkongensis]|uniref:DUF4376 domain-containing protein n=1 Tax=Laribacter hongkongensis TaxID=168471 RepID=UPI001EFC3889|nr:DUF4376 domain-containing protein [Laribacter hongkongensis]MCG9081073.1 DUF4376 domain-containing protein [Laribacter hongkongensis]
MDQYKLAASGVVRLSDGAVIPQDDGNRDWRDYQEWLSAGNIPFPAQTADEAKAAKWDAIKSERDRRTETGGYHAAGKWFHSDAKSRSQQQDNEAAGLGMVPVPWKTMDGSFVDMTPELAIKIRAARMASDRAIFEAAEAHRMEMEACVDPSGYDFSGGWPPCYGK